MGEADIHIRALTVCRARILHIVTLQVDYLVEDIRTHHLAVYQVEGIHTRHLVVCQAEDILTHLLVVYLVQDLNHKVMGILLPEGVIRIQALEAYLDQGLDHKVMDTRVQEIRIQLTIATRPSIITTTTVRHNKSGIQVHLVQ